MFENLESCLRIWKHVWGSGIMFEDLESCLRIWNHVWGSGIMFEDLESRRSIRVKLARTRYLSFLSNLPNEVFHFTVFPSILPFFLPFYCFSFHFTVSPSIFGFLKSLRDLPFWILYYLILTIVERIFFI